MPAILISCSCCWGGAVVCVLISIVIGCKEWSLTGLAILVRIITVTDG